MNLGIINSVFFGTEIDPYGDGLDEVKKLGFDHIDIYPADGEMTIEQLKTVRRKSKELDLPVRAGVALIAGP